MAKWIFGCGLPPPNGPWPQRRTTNKRVRNERMLRQLKVTLKYPSYRDGLAAIVGPS